MRNFGYKRVEMTHKTLRETFLNQKDFTSHYHLIQVAQLKNIKKEIEILIGGHI